jgi:hypothetical protein
MYMYLSRKGPLYVDHLFPLASTVKETEHTTQDAACVALDRHIQNGKSARRRAILTSPHINDTAPAEAAPTLCY